MRAMIVGQHSAPSVRAASARPDLVHADAAGCAGGRAHRVAADLAQLHGQVVEVGQVLGARARQQRADLRARSPASCCRMPSLSRHQARPAC